MESQIAFQVSVLNATSSSWEADDRAAAKNATHILAKLAMNEENRSDIVDGGAVPALVKHLRAPPLTEGDNTPRPFEHEVEMESAFTLGLLAINPNHQQLIVDNGALPLLIDLLKRHESNCSCPAANDVIRRAADAVADIAYKNRSIKTRFRLEGGIPPLVGLLEFVDPKVQSAAVGALWNLAFENDENKKQIVACNALPTLVLMLRSEDAVIQYRALGVLGQLVHSLPNIEKKVLKAGALQPVIGLLSSCCSNTQNQAAFLLGRFATTCKVHIVQRGAVGPLIEMLQSPDEELKKLSSFALGRLSQDTHNQAGIAQSGGLLPLLKLLDSNNGSLEYNAALALYGLVENEDNVFDFIKVGGLQKLQKGEFINQATKDYVAMTIKRLEEKIHGRVLKHLLYLMRTAEETIQRRVALALAHLCSEDQRKMDAKSPITKPQRPFSFKLWPPSQDIRMMLVERVINKLSSETIFTRKYGCLSKEQATENAKKIEEFAFLNADQKYHKEPSAAVRIYAKECNRLILEVLEKGVEVWFKIEEPCCQLVQD